MLNSKSYFEELKVVLDKLDHKQIDKFAQVIWSAHQKGKTIFFVGNGGSASTATHFAADIGKNVGVRIKAVSLCDNTAWVMALGNDLSYEDIFVEQLKNFAKKGDVVVAISGSGNSANVVKTLKYASKIGCKTVGMLGFSGGKMRTMVDVPVLVPVDHYGYVEGVHSEIQHFVVEALKIMVKSK